MKRRTEINIELTRTLLIHRRHAAPCPCATCTEPGEMVTPEEASVTADASTCLISQRLENDQVAFVENADAGEAIEIDSAEGQLILVAALRSLERRLSAEARATLSVPPEQTAARWSRLTRSLNAKLRWLRHRIIYSNSNRGSRKEN